MQFSEAFAEIFGPEETRKITDKMAVNIWKLEKTAILAAAMMQADDDMWSYIVEPNENGFVIAIKDENGEFVGFAK